MRYRRTHTPGARYFFTVNLADRCNTLLVDHVDVLREVTRRVKQSHPFIIDAVVILPDHLHAIWKLPQRDADFPMRWNLIKAGFSRALARDEAVSKSRWEKSERGIWQRRFWEHLIRDEEDFERHVNYMHYNPVKHGHVSRPVDWAFSSIHRYIENGILPADWAAGDDIDGSMGER
jgi:putative transposase